MLHLSVVCQRVPVADTPGTRSLGLCRCCKMVQVAGTTYDTEMSIPCIKMNGLLTMGLNSTTTPELLILGGGPLWRRQIFRVEGLLSRAPYTVFEYDFFHLRVAAFAFLSHVCSRQPGMSIVLVIR